MTRKGPVSSTVNVEKMGEEDHMALVVDIVVVETKHTGG